MSPKKAHHTCTTKVSHIFPWLYGLVQLDLTTNHTMDHPCGFTVGTSNTTPQLTYLIQTITHSARRRWEKKMLTWVSPSLPQQRSELWTASPTSASVSVLRLHRNQPEHSREHSRGSSRRDAPGVPPHGDWRMGFVVWCNQKSQETGGASPECISMLCVISVLATMCAIDYQLYLRTCTSARMLHTHTHTHTHSYMPTYKGYMHTYIYIHTHIHALLHTTGCLAMAKRGIVDGVYGVLNIEKALRS